MAGAPQGGRPSGKALRGLPQFGPGATVRRLGACTTSSSSAASADEPNTPFGLVERRLGDVEPEPEASPEPGGRAMGAIGATGRVIGPGSAGGRRLVLGARWVGEPIRFPGRVGGAMGAGGPIGGGGAIADGGAIGAGGGTFLTNGASYGTPWPNVRGKADGPSGGGTCCMEGPGPMPKGPGVNGTLGDITDGDMTPGGGGNIGGP